MVKKIRMNTGFSKNPGFSKNKSSFAKGFGKDIMKSDGKMILMLFIGVIIAVALYSVVADSVASGTVVSNTFTNVTVTAPAVNTSLALNGRDLVGTGNVWNLTKVISSTTTDNLTIREEIGSDGQKSVVLHTFVNSSGFAGEEVNVTYTSVPDGAVTGSSRAIFLLVIIFGAIAIMVFAVVMLFRGSFAELLKR